MSRNKKLGLLSLGIIIIVVLGLTVPLGSYTLRGCGSTTTTERLHLILGQTIEAAVEKEKAMRNSPNVGCSATTQYMLYMF